MCDIGGVEMNKQKYERSEIEVIEFKIDDVIMVSNPDDEYEGDKVFISTPIL